MSRWGGEEFVALLPDTGLAQAHAVADRFALAVAARPILLGSLAINVRVSGGVAARRGDELAGVRELIALADRALLSAKQNGRDRIETAE